MMELIVSNNSDKPRGKVAYVDSERSLLEISDPWVRGTAGTLKLQKACNGPRQRLGSTRILFSYNVLPMGRPQKDDSMAQPEGFTML